MELREALIDRISALRSEPSQAAWSDEAIADDILSMRELRDLIEKVERVRATLLDHPDGIVHADCLRRALDPEY